MNRRQKWFRLVGLTALVAVMGWKPAVAQDDPNDDLRELIPPGDPGLWDVRAGDELFGQLADAVGLSTEVGDIGSGSSLKGVCGGEAVSYDKDGDVLDVVIDMGDDAPPWDVLDGKQAFTKSNPFKVDTDGIVVYFGFMPAEVGADGPMNHTWYMKTAGVSYDKGGDPNQGGDNRNAGIVDLKNDLPIKFSAVVKVEGKLTSQNLGVCGGSGYVEFIGPGLTGPLGLAGLAMLGGGIVGLLFNSRPALSWKE